MWEMPHATLIANEDHAAGVRRLLASLGFTGTIGGVRAAVRHSVTRFRIRMTCVEVAYRRGTVRANGYAAHAWVRVEELQSYALSSPQRRLAEMLLNEDTARTCE
jgi:adenine-specific DNA glycosylase